MSEQPIEEPEGVEVTTAFTIVVEKDGNVSVHNQYPGTLILDRMASLVDIQAYSTQAAAEVAQTRMRQAVKDLLAPSDPSAPSAVVKKALRKRKKESD